MELAKEISAEEKLQVVPNLGNDEAILRPQHKRLTTETLVSVPSSEFGISTQQLEQFHDLPPGAYGSPMEAGRQAKSGATVMLSCQDAETLVQNAAQQAVSDAEDLMEAVMREAVRMLRDEFRGEIREVAESVTRLESVQGVLEKEVTSQKVQLDACCPNTDEKRCVEHESKLAVCLKALEELKKEVTYHKEQFSAKLLVAPNTDENRFADHEQKLAACLQTHEELKKQMTDHREQLTACLSLDQKQPAQVETLDQIEKQISGLHVLISNIQAESSKHASKEQVDMQIADLQAHLVKLKDESTEDQHLEKDGSASSDHVSPGDLSQANSESANDDLSELRRKMQAIQVQLSERTARPDFVTRCDLEAIRESALSDLREHGRQMKEYISELHKSSHPSEAKSQLSHSDLEEMMNRQLLQMQNKLSQQREQSALEGSFDVETIKHVDKQISDQEQESMARELRGHGGAIKECVNKQISDLQSHVSEIKEHLAQRTDKPDVVTRADQDAMRDYLLGQMSKLQGHMNHLSKLSETLFPQVQKELNALSSQVADIQKHSGQSSVELELKEVQRNMNAHLHELREVVDSLVKGNTKEKETYKWVAKVATLEHNVHELRSQTEDLRISVNSERRRTVQAKRKCEEEGIFCKFFL